MTILFIVLKSIFFGLIIGFVMQTTDNFISTSPAIVLRIIYFFIGFIAVSLLFRINDSKWIIGIACGLNFLVRMIQAFKLKYQLRQIQIDPFTQVAHNIISKQTNEAHGTEINFLALQEKFINKAFMVCRSYLYGIVAAWILFFDVYKK